VNKSVEVEGLTKRFGPIVAVDNISFTVESGESLCFLGPNGAGKSTAMKMITGFLPPTAGSVTVCGHDVIRQPIEAKRRIGYLPEGAPLYGEMSPKSLLNFVADIRRLSPEQKRRGIDYAIECLHLENVLYQPIETLSKGYKRRVGLAQAIVHDPDVGDKAIIISTHILEEVDAVCSRAIIISRGRIVADQTPAQLEEHSRFHNAVGIRIPSDRVEHCVTLLNQIGEVSAVETKVQPNGLGELTAFPAEGCEILDLVRSMIDREGLDVAEIYVDRGRLDDVFRDLTIGGTSPPPASDKSLL
jgi:ABC-2 type transport system ATP-binding protein